MAIGFRNIGTRGISTGDPATSPGLPTGWAAGDMHLLAVGSKASTPPTLNTPSGWTAPANNTITGGAGGVGGNSGGPTRVTGLYRQAVGGDAAPAIDLSAAGSPTFSTIFGFTKGASESWVAPVCAVAADTTGSSTSYGPAAAAVDLGAQAGDWIVAVTFLNDDAGTFNLPGTLTVAGLTLGTVVNRLNQSTTTGNDGRMFAVSVPVTSGTDTAGPVMAMTLSAAGIANLAGCTVFWRLRVTTAPVDADGTLAVTAGRTGTAGLAAAVSGNLAVTAAGTGAVALALPAAGTAPVTVTVTGAAEVTRPVAGTTAVTVSAVADAAVARSVTGNLTSVVTLDGAAAAARPFDGARPATVTATGDASLSRVGIGALVVTATTAGTAAVDRPVSGVVVAITVAGLADAVVARPATGSRSIVAVLTGEAFVAHQAAGDLTVVATVAGDAGSGTPTVDVSGGLIATVVAAATVEAGRQAAGDLPLSVASIANIALGTTMTPARSDATVAATMASASSVAGRPHAAAVTDRRTSTSAVTGG